MSTSLTHDDDGHFTINNLPYGVISTPTNPARRLIATRLLSDVFVLEFLISNGLLTGVDTDIRHSLTQTTLNNFAALPKSSHLQFRNALRKSLQQIDLSDPLVKQCAYPVSDIVTHMPIIIGDFTDFSCSQNHVLNASHAMTSVRSMPPGFLHFPVGYSGRCSSIVPSGTRIRRPLGQYRDRAGTVVFGPSEKVDFELEIGVIVGMASRHGEPVSMSNAESHMFGLVLVNDWSARDIQGLEMNPLGPLNGKSFGTSISPWVISIEALERFKCPSAPRNSDAPTAVYLQGVDQNNHYAINLEVDLIAPTPPISTRINDKTPVSSGSLESVTTICKSEFRDLYWPINSLVAHQTINGCPLSSGDLLGTGTISGSKPGSFGCLLEITEGGKQSITLNNGKSRTWLEDGDGVRLTAWAGEVGTDDCVGFGECIGWIDPAVELEY